MRNASELDCRVKCIMCETTNRLAMYAFRRNDIIVGWVFLCENCNKQLNDKGYQLGWFFEDEEGKKLF